MIPPPRAPLQSTRPSRSLFVSDLDFTLLRSDATLSERTVETVNDVIAAGYHFTCATARSFRSALRVTAGLELQLPLITYGGAVCFDPVSASIVGVEPLPAEVVDAIVDVTKADPRVEPILFAMVDGRDRVCWRENRTTEYVESFLRRRAEDPRLLPLPDWKPLNDATVFYATLIGQRTDVEDIRRELQPALAKCFDTVGPDGYHPHQTWFEIMSSQATKAAAARRLADQLEADALVAFGDNLNDIPLFEIADHSCAVDNAVLQLLEIADEVIPSNENDGVASWLAREILATPEHVD